MGAEPGPPAGRRRGFTLIEGLVGVGIFALVLTMTLTLSTGIFRDFFKGEDALTSVQEASLVLLRLRKDALAMTLDGGGSPLRFRQVRDRRLRQEGWRLDPATRALVRELREVEDQDDRLSQDLTEVGFRIRSGDEVVPVTYRFLPSEARIVREVPGQPPKSYAVPRLRDFHLQLEAEVVGDPTAYPLFERPGTVPGALRRLWVHVQFRVKGERLEAGIETTRVDIETRIFPKRLNRRLGSAWIPTS